MSNVKVFVDSTCDLPDKILADNDISMIPLYINFNEKSFKDRHDINVEELYNKVEETNCIPKTSAPSPLDFYNAFKPHIESGADIIYIGLSSYISSTIKNALLAAEEFPRGRIHIVDSLNLSVGTGILVMKALELIKMGLNAYDTAITLEALIPKVKTAFTVDNLQFLRMGGRCSAMQSMVGGILQIKPILKVVEGRINLAGKMRGRKKALLAILNEVSKNINNIDTDRIIIAHSIGIESANFLKQELLKAIDVKEILIFPAGCVISSHCGKNTVGIIYMNK